jgi:hypothetical protein
MFSCSITGNRYCDTRVWREAPRVRDGLCGSQASRDVTSGNAARSEDHPAGLASASVGKEQWIVDTELAFEADAIKTVATKATRPTL